MASASLMRFTNPFPCASPSPRWGRRRRSSSVKPAACGLVSRRRAVSDVAILGATAAAASYCIDLFPMPARAAMLEPDVIRYRKLDSGVKLEAQLTSLTVRMIRGLKDVIIGMKAGGKRRALIPPQVGYTDENLQPIPEEFGPRRSLLSHAKEPLVFEVQLLKVL
uniref:peptidylprolyl isomerase n=1 Tax=Leersia perrieri TaxID=77586 RepID=A0A0D9VDE6_9ORYZ